jgi:hypothetical protein
MHGPYNIKFIISTFRASGFITRYWLESKNDFCPNGSLVARKMKDEKERLSLIYVKGDTRTGCWR